jgi:uncharacterized protein (TIGR03000 family)
MYSIVMLTALTATPDVPQFNGYFRDLFNRNGNSCSGCSGCNGCSGAVRYSCFGGGCSGSAYPTSCSGCCGSSSIFGWNLGSRVRSWFEPSGSCCGSHSYGCCGSSASSCFGGPAYSYTPVFNGGLSCQGGMPFSAPPPMFDMVPNATPFPAPGSIPSAPGSIPGAPGIPYAVPDPAPGTMGARPAAPANNTLVSNGPTARAAVVVRLPADAKLFADGRALNLTGAERKFVSPELPANQEFIYRFKAEYERDGETVSVTKKVTVRGGTTVAVEFTDLTAAKPSTTPSTTTASGTDKTDKGSTPVVKPVSQEPVKVEPPVKAPATDTHTPPGGDRATITVKLPPGATLYVDDRKSPSAEPVRSFSTPVLPTGREFAYLLKAEVVRNGQPETLTQKVPFRAGERVVVDFTSLGK